MRGKVARELRKMLSLQIESERFSQEPRNYGFVPNSDSDERHTEKGVSPLRLMNVPGRVTYQQLKNQIKLQKKENK